MIDETYDYLYNVWSYERGYVYDVEEVPRSGFYHYWHGANLDVIPHSAAHPASAKEIRSLPSGEALHKGEKTVTVSMDSVLHHRDEEKPAERQKSSSEASSTRKAGSSANAGKTPAKAKAATSKKASAAGKTSVKAASKTESKRKTSPSASGEKTAVRKTTATKKKTTSAKAKTSSGEGTTARKATTKKKIAATKTEKKAPARKTTNAPSSVSSSGTKAKAVSASARKTASSEAKKKTGIFRSKEKDGKDRLVRNREEDFHEEGIDKKEAGRNAIRREGIRTEEGCQEEDRLPFCWKDGIKEILFLRQGFRVRFF